MAGTLPLLAAAFAGPLAVLIRRAAVWKFWPEAGWPRWVLRASVAAAIVFRIAAGLRSLSADYLLRVQAVARGGRAAESGARLSVLGTLVARLFGGPAARAGSEFAARMMLRDLQFRKQMAPLSLIVVAWLLRVAPHGCGVNPSYEDSIRSHVAQLTGEWGSLYTEIG